VKPNFVANNDVWIQDAVTPASKFMIPYEEYEAWVKGNKIDVVFCDQNYQFDEISRLRQIGVKTIGRFVWESFGADHVDGAKGAFDVIYSLTRCEQRRYHKFGIDSPYLRWGIHPELLLYGEQPKCGVITFFYPGGYLSPRKPTGAVIEAFSKVPISDIRLIIKTQRKLRIKDLVIPIDHEQARKKNIREDDPLLIERLRLLNDNRISVISDDRSVDDYCSLFASCHVCLAPSRWEGLGLHFFESIGFGLPIITNNNPPMNEMVVDRENGYLVRSSPLGLTKSGIEAFEPDVEDLSKAITYMANEHELGKLTRNTRNISCSLRWKDTIEDFIGLLGDVMS